MNADVNESMEYRKEAQGLMQQRQGLIRNVYYASSRMFVLQRIYYMAGDTAKAEQITKVGNDITQNRVGFPKSPEENQKIVEQIFGQ